MTSVKSVAAAAFAALAAASIGFAQERKPDTPAAPDVITVEGCIRGSVLELTGNSNANLVGRTLATSELVLDGAREMVQTLKNSHDGHYLKVTGELKIPPPPDNEQVNVDTVDLGRAGRVTIGRRERLRNSQSVPQPSLPQPARIVVDSFEHISDRCLTTR